jgi:hypothetical protein
MGFDIRAPIHSGESGDADGPRWGGYFHFHIMGGLVGSMHIHFHLVGSGVDGFDIHIATFLLDRGAVRPSPCT